MVQQRRNKTNYSAKQDFAKGKSSERIGKTQEFREKGSTIARENCG